MGKRKRKERKGWERRRGRIRIEIGTTTEGRGFFHEKRRHPEAPKLPPEEKLN